MRTSRNVDYAEIILLQFCLKSNKQDGEIRRKFLRNLISIYIHFLNNRDQLRTTNIVANNGKLRI